MTTATKVAGNAAASAAVATNPEPVPTIQERVAALMPQLRQWADLNHITLDGLYETLKQEQSEGGETTEHFPPFHTVLLWTDIFSPSGVKYHVTVREGATQETVITVLGVAASALDDLVQNHGWMPADRLPKAQEPAAERRPAAKAVVKTQAPAVKKIVRKVHGASEDDGGDTKEIAVVGIIKDTTQGGEAKFTVRGAPWKKFGVPCYADSGKIGKLAELVDLEAWDDGEDLDVSDLSLTAVVKLKANGSPEKVVDWMGDGVIDID